MKRILSYLSVEVIEEIADFDIHVNNEKTNDFSTDIYSDHSLAPLESWGKLQHH